MTPPAPKPTIKELRSFGLIAGAILAVAFGLLLPWLFGHRSPIWPWVVASALWLPALSIPAALRPIYRGWMKFGHVAGWVNTRIILVLMFYLMIWPTGAVMRLLRKDPMARRLDAGQSTYRVPSKAPSRENMERPF